MIEVGGIAPDFTLPDSDGKSVTLADFKGKKVVLYFYPKDNTPGCTKEACSFRDNFGAVKAKGAVVLGVSPDKAESHVKFRDKFELPFTLLCDLDHSVAEVYGAWGEKKMYGKIYQGLIRKTFIIDEKGVIIKIFNKVKTAVHAEEVLEFL